MQDAPVAFETPAWTPRWKRWLLLSPLARLLIFILLFVAGVVLAGFGFHMLGLGRNSPPLQIGMAQFIGRAIPPLLAYLILVKWIERRWLSELSPSILVPHVLIGILAGALLFGGIVGVLWLLGSYHVTAFNPHPDWLPQVLMVGLGAGIGEEIVFRGALFRIVEEGLGTWIALFVSALLFGFLHANNPGATLWSSAAIAIEAGLLFGMLYHVTRSLPVCMGLHASWNVMQGVVFGIPVSGTRADGFLVSHRTGPDWLSGGAFGAEASVVALTLCSLVTIALVAIALRSGTIVPPFWMRPKPMEETGWDRLDKFR
jgi:membrane protease YdiL (CAAX protease family)